MSMAAPTSSRESRHVALHPLDQCRVVERIEVVRVKYISDEHLTVEGAMEL
jgi:hypothetical protein